MSQRLTDMRIRQVSLVDKGANKRTFALLKRDAEEDAMTLPAPPADQTPAGIAGWLRKAADLVLGKSEPVAKVMTFAEIVAGAELRDALYDSWYTLEDALWSAIYAVDDNGQALPIEAKQALVAQDLDEFKAYLLAAMASGVTKRDASPSARARGSLDALVRKVGRKISGSRMERLSAAAEALNSVLAEVAEAQADDAAETAEEADVEKSELVAAVSEAVTKAQEPLIARIEPLEKAAPGAAPEPVAKGEEDELTLASVAEAVAKIADRLEAVEKRPGERASLDGQDGSPVKKSRWAGIF